jgi:hypothetical protein
MQDLLDSLQRNFAALHIRSIALLQKTDQQHLFRKPRELTRSMAMFSIGEYLLRSAGVVEQTSGGLTTRLWDDPFEWTLPETLSTKTALADYLKEVETGRLSAFKFFNSDEDLTRRIPAPEDLRSIFDLLLETLARSEHFQGRAFAVFQMFSDEKLPRM